MTYHVVFHDLDPWEAIKYSIFDTYAPYIVWIVMSVFGTLLIGAFALFVWRNQPEEHRYPGFRMNKRLGPLMMRE